MGKKVSDFRTKWGAHRSCFISFLKHRKPSAHLFTSSLGGRGLLRHLKADRWGAGAHRLCPHLPDSPGTCTAKSKELILNECGTPIHATWEYFPKSSNSFPQVFPFLIERYHTEAYTTFVLSNDLMGWYTSMWTKLKHMLWCIFTTGATVAQVPATSGFVSILSKTWLGNLEYVNSFSSY